MFMKQSSTHLTRRDLFAGLAAAGLGAVMARGQHVNRSTAKGGRIDVHHHHSPPALRTGPQGPGRGGYGPWTPELSLQMMDKYDIAVSILSMKE